MVRAIVLAAGASSRMGRPKPSLPIGPGDTFLSRILRTLTCAGLPEIIVVTGRAATATMNAAGRTREHVRFVHNDRWSEGQLSSLLAGLDEPPADRVEAALVALVDAPFFAVATVEAVLAGWRRSRAPIVRPARGALHGHPVLFDRTLFDELRAADPEAGAKPVVRAHEGDIVNVPVDDAGAFLDIDTEQDYREALSQLGR